MVPYELHEHVSRISATLLRSCRITAPSRCDLASDVLSMMVVADGALPAFFLSAVIQIFPDDWRMRIIAIRDIAFRFYKPLFERIWFMVATMCVLFSCFYL